MSLTCVSGYWNIKNKHGNKFDQWFENTLKINCPYVFFTDDDTIDIIKKHRGNRPTYYIELSIDDFYTQRFKDRMITHEAHCPSVELNLVWNEKIFMIQKALEINPFKSDFFMWMDAGISSFRNRMPPPVPFPDARKLNRLPKDKFIYSSSHNFTYNDNFKKGQYHLHHHIAGTSYILHKSIINKFVEIYTKYMEELVDETDIWTDQVVLTHIYKDHPELFFKLCDNYGTPPFYLY